MTSDQEMQVEPEPDPRAARSGEVVPGTAETRKADSKRAARNEAEHGGPARTARPGDQAKPHASGLERTVGILRAAVPLVQKVLPLLDGNVALAVANLLAPRLQPPPVNLAPVEASISRLREDLAVLSQGAGKHEAMLRRVESEVEIVKDSLERSSEAQKELRADLDRVRTRMTVLSVVGFLLLAASIAANLIVLVKTGRLLP